MIVQLFSLIALLIAPVNVQSDRMDVDAEDDFIHINYESRSESTSSKKSPPRTASTGEHVDTASELVSCADANSFQVVLGGCAGPEVCNGDTRVGSSVFTEHERQHLGHDPSDSRSFTNFEYCADDSVARRNSIPLRTLVAEEWRQIQLPAPVIEVQPADQRTLVNLDTYAQAPQDEFNHATTLLGQQVDIRANAVQWHWDLGDGSPVITEDHPGTAFPEPTGFFHYRQPGNYIITLTIDWKAEFSADSGRTWQAVSGINQTTATTDIEVGEHRPRLQYNP